MFNKTRIKIAGAGLSVAVLFAGHGVLPAHADAPIDTATLLADGTASDALDAATDALTWTDPNTTCGPTVDGKAVNNEINVQRAAIAAEEAGVANVACFSFTHLNYNLAATLTLQEYNPWTGAWNNLPGCVDARNMNAVDGAATVPLLVECFEPISNTPVWHLHRAHVVYAATTGSAGKADSFPPYLINY